MTTFNGLDLDSVKSFLGIALSDLTQDFIVSTYAEAALAMLRQLTGRQLLRGWYRDTLAAIPDRLYLREYPVHSVISVQLGGVDVPTTDYQVFLDNGFIQFKNLCTPRYSQGCPGQFFTVDYIAGYETLPGNYLLAVYSGIQAAITQRNQISSFGGAVKRISVYDVGVTDFQTSKSGSSNSALRDTISEQLAELIASTPTLGAPLLHESERIGDSPGSPD